MKYWLHPEAESDLREAAEYYRERAGPALSQSLLAEFERAVQLLMQRPLLGALWLYGNWIAIQLLLLPLRIPHSLHARYSCLY